MQNRQEASRLLTSKIGDEKGLVLGLIMPF